MVVMQTNVVMQSMWLSKLKGHLEEHKTKKKGKKSNKLMGDGIPHLCTGDEFAAAVEKDVREQKQKAHEKEVR